MGKYATVSVKIPITLKEELQRLGIKPSKLLRKAIEDEVKRKEVERIRSEIESLEPTLAKITVGTEARSIREDREQR
jgi:post-segregation antitoxin (ccd killing protein)